MAKFDDKISSIIKSQLPEFVVSEHPKFIEFLSAYYTFMESGELRLYDVETTDGILLETETNQENKLLLDGGRLGSTRTQLDAGDKLLQEDSAFGKFQVGEVVTGQTSKATATILCVEDDKIIISAQDKFIQNEFILGGTSNGRAKILNYRPNPVNSIQDLVNFRDPDGVIQDFLNKFRNEFLTTLPENLNENVDKRKLIKNVRELYRLKGTRDGNSIFFRLLFGENVETEYLREQILRVSDGNWSTKKIIRAIDVIGDTTSLIGREIQGETTDAKAIVENVFRYTFGAYSISEFVVNSETITGTFQTGEVVRGTESDENDVFIKAQITGIPGTKNITNDGALNNLTDAIVLTGGGQGALFQTSNIGGGPLTEIIIDDGGFDFEIGDNLSFNDSGTKGGGAKGFVSVVNGGIQHETGSANGDTLFVEDSTNADPLLKYLSGPVIKYDRNTLKSGSLKLPFTVTNTTGGATPGTYTFTYDTQATNKTVSGNPKGLILSIVVDGSSAIDSTTDVTVVNKGEGFTVGDQFTIPASVIGNPSSDTIITVSNVTGGHAELVGTINDADAGRTSVTANRRAVTLTGKSSGATADLRYNVKDTTLEDVDFADTILYISYTNDKRFTKGEDVTVTRNTESSFYNANAPTFEIGLDLTFGEEVETSTTASRDSSYEMVRSLATTSDIEGHINVEDETVAGDNYSGSKIVQERNTGVGDITDIFMINFGNNYESLPTISFADEVSGQDAKIKCFGTEIGRIVEIKTVEHGIRYEQPPTPPSIEFLNNSIVVSVLGAFVVDETVTGDNSGFTAKVVSWDATRGLLKLKDVSGNPQINEIIRGGTSSANGTLFKTDHASATVNVGPLSDTDGEFIDEDGHLSESTMKVQDSLVYQDFSYLIKVGRSINEWRSSFKKTMHVAGFYFTGQVDIQTRLNARLKDRIVGATTGNVLAPIGSILNTLFSTVARRKLGTETDGTTLRANAKLATGVDSNPNTARHFDDTTRDVTLKSKFAITAILSRQKNIVTGISVKRGFGIGPKYSTLNLYPQTTFARSGAGINFGILEGIKIQGTGNTGIENRGAIFTATSDQAGQRLRTSFTIPAEIVISQRQFDNTGFRFDTNQITFDNNTP